LNFSTLKNTFQGAENCKTAKPFQLSYRTILAPTMSAGSPAFLHASLNIY